MPRKKGTLGISEIIGDKRDRILELADKHGAFNVRVFGSVAREDSDVDFIAEFEDDKDVFDLVKLWLDLKDLLQRDVDLIADGDHLKHVGVVARETGVSLTLNDHLAVRT